MAEMSQNLLKTEAARFNNLLRIQKILITEKMSRCKEMIKQFHLKEDCGLSITNISQEIDSTYRNIRVDLGVMVDNWNEFIRLAVISKEPQPVTIIIFGSVCVHPNLMFYYYSGRLLGLWRGRLSV